MYSSCLELSHELQVLRGTTFVTYVFCQISNSHFKHNKSQTGFLSLLLPGSLPYLMPPGSSSCSNPRFGVPFFYTPQPIHKQICCLYIHNTFRIWPFLLISITITLAHSTTISPVGHCNTFLHSCPVCTPLSVLHRKGLLHNDPDKMYIRSCCSSA